MKNRPVMEAEVEGDQLEMILNESHVLGVPAEYYFIEGWRIAFWEAMRERERQEVEFKAAKIEEFHIRIEENSKKLYEEHMRKKALRETNRSRPRDAWGNLKRNRKDAVVVGRAGGTSERAAVGGASRGGNRPP